MKKLLTILFGTTSLLTTSCYDASIKVQGNIKITINDEIEIPIKIDSEVTLNEGTIKVNELTYKYVYNNKTNQFDSHFEYKGSIYPYNYERNSIKIGGVEYSLDQHSFVELQKAIIDEYYSKEA